MITNERFAVCIFQPDSFQVIRTKLITVKRSAYHETKFLIDHAVTNDKVCSTDKSVTDGIKTTCNRAGNAQAIWRSTSDKIHRTADRICVNISRQRFIYFNSLD